MKWIRRIRIRGVGILRVYGIRRSKLGESDLTDPRGCPVRSCLMLRTGASRVGTAELNATRRARAVCAVASTELIAVAIFPVVEDRRALPMGPLQRRPERWSRKISRVAS
jgi:hypothetical protein